MLLHVSLLQSKIPVSVLQELYQRLSDIYEELPTKAQLSDVTELIRLLEDRDTEQGVKSDVGHFDELAMRDALVDIFTVLDPEKNVVHQRIYDMLPEGILTKPHYSSLLQVSNWVCCLA